MKWLLIPVLFFFCLTFVSSASITGYTVDENIPVNDALTIYGTYNSADDNEAVLCAFYVFNDENKLTIRLSDEYTFTNGVFATSYVITEPLFERGQRYLVTTKCGSISSDAYFDADQKEDILLGIKPQGIIAEFAFWTDRENSMTAVFALGAFLLVVAIVGAVIVLVARGTV